METFIEKILSSAGRTVRHWWMFLVAGLLLVAGGITVFFYPAESYATLSIMFGILMLVSGVAELVTACTSRNWFLMRSSSIIGGIFDVILGLILCLYPGITLVLLPIMLGIFMLYHSFMTIGFGSDLRMMGVQKSGWATALGIALLVLSLMILVKPFGFGAGVVTALTGTALILMGLSAIAAALKLKDIHRNFTHVDWGDN